MNYKPFEVFGIEIEYAVVGRDNLQVKPVVDKLITTLCGSPNLFPTLGNAEADNELAAHVVEMKCKVPTADWAAQARDFQQMVSLLNKTLDGLDSRLMPGGSHPFMDPARESKLWEHDGREIYSTYDGIFGCRGHGWFNLQSVHLNLPFSDDASFNLLHNAVSLLLPLMPALAAASPVLEGKRHAWKDARLFHYLQNQRRFPSVIGPVIPEPLRSEAEYRAKILAPMYREIASSDPEGLLQDEWLNSRAAIARFDRGAIEVRCIDTQECPLADLALCFFFSGLLRALCESRADLYGAHAEVPGGVSRALFEDCARVGMDVLLPKVYPQEVFGLSQRERSARDFFQDLLSTGFAYATVAENALFRPVIEHILTRGSLSDRIIRLAGPREDWLSAYREVCECLATGRLLE